MTPGLPTIEQVQTHAELHQHPAGGGLWRGNPPDADASEPVFARLWVAWTPLARVAWAGHLPRYKHKWMWTPCDTTGTAVDLVAVLWHKQRRDEVFARQTRRLVTQALRARPVRPPNVLFALGQLRHLYEQMLDGRIKDAAQAGRHLLGPAIEILERAHTPHAKVTDPEYPPCARCGEVNAGTTDRGDRQVCHDCDIVECHEDIDRDEVEHPGRYERRLTALLSGNPRPWEVE